MTDTPAGAPLPGAPGATGATGPRDVVSVAELLARHSRASHASSDGAGPLTGPVLSVGDLLRREGRPPVAEGASADAASAGDIAAAGAPGGWPDIDLPQPRSAAVADGWTGRQVSGRRRAGVVAGALLAAGSVLGAALYNGVGTENSDARAAADGLFPGFGLPTAGTPDTLPAQYLPANVALSSPLPDAPAPGATDWMAVAFGPQRPVQAVAAGRTPGTAAGPAAAVPAPRTPSTGNPGTGSPSSPTVPGPRGAGGTGSPLAPIVAPINNPDRAPAGNLLEPVTGTPPSRGGTSTGPLQDVTENVRPVGNAVGGVVAPVAQAAAPVGRAVGGAVSPVTEAVRPVTDAVKPVTRPLTDTLEPVTTPVLGALSPVTEPVLDSTKPLTGPVLKAAEPVTGLLDTSAKKPDTGSSSEEATQPLQAVTKPVGQVVSTVTEPVGGVLGGVTKGAGGLLGG